MAFSYLASFIWSANWDVFACPRFYTVNDVLREVQMHVKAPSSTNSQKGKGFAGNWKFLFYLLTYTHTNAKMAHQSITRQYCYFQNAISPNDSCEVAGVELLQHKCCIANGEGQKVQRKSHCFILSERYGFQTPLPVDMECMYVAKQFLANTCKLDIDHRAMKQKIVTTNYQNIVMMNMKKVMQCILKPGALFL